MPHHSIARINRELGKAIVALDAVRFIPQGEPTPNVEATIGVVPMRLEDVPPAEPSFTVKHAWPPRYRQPRSGYSIHIQPYEFGTIPATWMERSIALADDVWCYTNYVRQLYIDAGMPAERTHVVPLGFDPQIYRPDVTPYDVGSDSRFVFLFVGGTIWRKGIETLLDAYLAAFKPDDDVMLVIKDFGASTFYANSNASARIDELAQRTDVPMVRYTAGDMSDAGLASLYRRANVLAHPYRGEGFGLPVLEAMACGTPPMVTAGGAPDDFVNENIGYRLPARRLELGTSFAGLEHATPGWVLDVDPALLAASMRAVFASREEARERGARAAAHVHGAFTWAHGARVAVDRMRALATRTPIVRSGEEDLNDYELRALSRHGEDGIVMELFGRLRAVDPLLVEFGAGAASNGAALTQRIGWGALNVAHIPEPIEAAALLAEHAIPEGFDLLSIDGAHDALALRDVLSAFGPRAIVMRKSAETPWTPALLDGYAFLGCDRSGTSAFYVRRNLLALTGFPERRVTDR